MSYEKKLMQLKGLVSKNKPVEKKEEVQEVALPFYTDSWVNAGLSLKRNEHGFYFQREIFYELFVFSCFRFGCSLLMSVYICSSPF